MGPGRDSWDTTVTPLASIMGRGFLVSTPLLAGTFEHLAIVAWRQTDKPELRRKAFLFGGIGFVCLLVFAFGIPSE